MTTPQRAAFIDGPFVAADKPWLLSNQRKLGIAVQDQSPFEPFGYFTQPHGYLEGSTTDDPEEREMDNSMEGLASGPLDE